MKPTRWLSHCWPHSQHLSCGCRWESASSPGLAFQLGARCAFLLTGFGGLLDLGRREATQVCFSGWRCTQEQGDEGGTAFLAGWQVALKKCFKEILI